MRTNAPITKQQFRGLLTVAVAASLLGVVVSVVWEPWLPELLRNYLEQELNEDLNAKDIALITVAIPLLTAWIYSIVGLYRFWPSAPSLTTTVWAIGFVLQAFCAPQVQTGLATSLFEFGALAIGAILAIAYLTTAREWFVRTTSDYVSSSNTTSISSPA